MTRERYRIYSKERSGAYQIFRLVSATLIENCPLQSDVTILNLCLFITTAQEGRNKKLVFKKVESK